MPHKRYSGLIMSVICAMLSSLPAHASKLKTLYAFEGGADGSLPVAQLVYHGERLYGVTRSGGGTGCGGTGCGTIFKVDPKSRKETVVYSFQGSTDGLDPEGLIFESGLFYGAALGGGTGNNGTVFKFDPTTGKLQVVYSFTGGADGSGPGEIIYWGDKIYGTTYGSGAGGFGTAYAFDPSSGGLTVLHAFRDGVDGGIPLGNLTVHAGSIFGTAIGGGRYGQGVVFRINMATAKFKTIYSFTGFADGSWPIGIVAINDTLYGTASLGAIDNGGTVYSLSPATRDLTVLHAFTGMNYSRLDGLGPDLGVIAISGILYGVTRVGGIVGGPCTSGCGTVFRVNPSSGAEKLLHVFKYGSDGALPNGNLIYENGYFYGTTSQAGSSGCGGGGCGTVFKIEP